MDNSYLNYVNRARLSGRIRILRLDCPSLGDNDGAVEPSQSSLTEYGYSYSACSLTKSDQVLQQLLSRLKLSYVFVAHNIHVIVLQCPRNLLYLQSPRNLNDVILSCSSSYVKATC